jgi:hypothetical protein
VHHTTADSFQVLAEVQQQVCLSPAAGLAAAAAAALGLYPVPSYAWLLAPALLLVKTPAAAAVVAADSHCCRVGAEAALPPAPPLLPLLQLRPPLLPL